MLVLVIKLLGKQNNLTLGVACMKVLFSFAGPLLIKILHTGTKFGKRKLRMSYTLSVFDLIFWKQQQETTTTEAVCH